MFCLLRETCMLDTRIEIIESSRESGFKDTDMHEHKEIPLRLT